MNSLVKVEFSKDELRQRAIQFFTNKTLGEGAPKYKVISSTDTSITFEDGKDISVALISVGILFFLICVFLYPFLFILGGVFFFIIVVLYYLLSNRHIIIMTLSEVADGTDVEFDTNSSKSFTNSQEFIQRLSKKDEAVRQEISHVNLENAIMELLHKKKEIGETPTSKEILNQLRLPEPSSDYWTDVVALLRKLVDEGKVVRAQKPDGQIGYHIK